MNKTKFFITILSLLVIVFSVSACDFIDSMEEKINSFLIEKHEDVIDFAKGKQGELEKRAQEEADRLRQELQDKIDGKIDEVTGNVAEGLKDRVNIMGEEASSSEEVEDIEESNEGIELGELPE